MTNERTIRDLIAEVLQERGFKRRKLYLTRNEGLVTIAVCIFKSQNSDSFLVDIGAVYEGYGEKNRAWNSFKWDLSTRAEVFVSNQSDWNKALNADKPFTENERCAIFGRTFDEIQELQWSNWVNTEWLFAKAQLPGDPKCSIRSWFRSYVKEQFDLD